jgi:hypothetical protein
MVLAERPIRASALLALFMCVGLALPTVAQASTGHPSGNSDPTECPAEKAQETLEERLDRAICLYHKNTHAANQEALSQLRIIDSRQRRKATPQRLSKRRWAQALVYKGVLLHWSGDRNGAEDAFHHALRLDASVNLPEKHVSESTQELFGIAKNEAPPQIADEPLVRKKPQKPPPPREGGEPPVVIQDPVPPTPEPSPEPVNSPPKPVDPPPEPVDPPLEQSSAPPTNNAPQSAPDTQGQRPESSPPAAVVLQEPQQTMEPAKMEPVKAESRSQNPIESIKGSQAAMALGGVLAVAGAIILTASDSSNPKHRSTLQWAGGLASAGGIALGVWGLRLEVAPTLSVSEQSVSAGTRISF